MSLNKTTYLVMGLRIPDENAADYGIEDYWNDKWLPYIEGQPGYYPYALIRGEEISDYFFGYIIANSGYGKSGTKEPQNIEIPDRQDVINKLRELGLNFKDEEVKLWFFEQYD